MLCTHDCKSSLCITMAWDVLSSVQCCIWTGELCSYLKLLDCDWNLCFSEEWRQASGLSLSQPQAFNFKDTDVSAVPRFFQKWWFHYCQMLMNQTRRSGSRLHKLQIICCWLIIKWKTHQIYMSAEKSPTSVPFSFIKEVLKMSLYTTTL